MVKEINREMTRLDESIAIGREILATNPTPEERSSISGVLNKLQERRNALHKILHSRSMLGNERRSHA